MQHVALYLVKFPCVFYFIPSDLSFALKDFLLSLTFLSDKRVKDDSHWALYKQPLGLATIMVGLRLPGNQILVVKGATADWFVYVVATGSQIQPTSVNKTTPIVAVANRYEQRVVRKVPSVNLALGFNPFSATRHSECHQTYLFSLIFLLIFIVIRQKNLVFGLENISKFISLA